MGNRVSFANQHVLITGGSEGIGLELAAKFLEAGARVTILSRSTAKLNTAQAELQARFPGSQVNCVSADVSEYEPLKASLDKLQAEHGHVDVAVCNAGFAIPGLFVEQDMAEVQKTMQVNYFGAHHTVKAVLPGMLQRGVGHVCFVSSAAALCGIVGYSSYSPSKGAIRLLADCLRSELQGTGVGVSVGYPPDTKTAGFAAEEVTKPAATTRISEAFQDTVYEPSVVAAALFRGLQRGAYHLPNPDFMLQLLISQASGLTPKPLGWFLEMLLAPLLVIVTTVARGMQDGIVRKYNEGLRRDLAAAGAGTAARAEGNAEALLQ